MSGSDSDHAFLQVLEKHFKPVRNQGPLQDCIDRWLAGGHLSRAAARTAFEELFDENVSEYQIGEFLYFADPEKLNAEEITGFAQSLLGRAPALKITAGNLNLELLGDTCGTGGDTLSTFNISTAIVFILAADGLPIAKHGNRAATSRCGSADVLEQLGVNINLSPDQVSECIENTGIGFMFAPVFHSATRRVQGVRKILANELSGGTKRKTIFNILGPLSNPARTPWQLLGVYDPSFLEKIATVLQNLNVSRAVVVHGHAGKNGGEKGLDEVSLLGPTDFAELKDKKIHLGGIMPEDFGLPEVNSEEIAGGDVKYNAELLRGILIGEIHGPKRNMVLANAALARAVGRNLPIPDSLKESVAVCAGLIDSGAAYQKLELLIKATNELAQG